MRRLRIGCLVAVTVLALAGPAMAQDTPKGDIAVSYSVLYDKELPDDIFGVSGWLPTGWLAAGSVRVTGPLSIVGEVGANYKGLTFEGVDVTVSVYSFLGGVKYSPKVNSKARPFVQLLVGLGRYNASAMGITGSQDAFASQIGGGVDVAVSKKLAVRFQGDYRALRVSGTYGNEFRLATGLVYNF